MAERSEDEMHQIIQMVRARADIPRVRSREIKQIIEALGSLINEGMIDLTPAEPS